MAAVESGVPPLVEARGIVAEFQAMVRQRRLEALDPWLERARSSLVASFAAGVLKDKAAVAAAITSPWSNGQTEGQITKLCCASWRSRLPRRQGSFRTRTRRN